MVWTTLKRNPPNWALSASASFPEGRVCDVWRTMLRLLPIILLAACSQGGHGPGGRPYAEIGADGWKWRAPTRYYPPPGPPEDPWGPYIREAAARYRVPGRWVRAVMHQESGGQEQAVSSAGAMGLMQVMPATYEKMRVRNGLGGDPYDPHDNILAGTAYIREMYDRYGAPGFLAAYNAGPDRVDSYLAGAATLPDETVNYVAAITPNLGNVRLSGPFARYASARFGRGAAPAPSIASLAAGCDLNAAYNPNNPCTTAGRQAMRAAPVEAAYVPQVGVNGCDLNVAYDPRYPCTSGSRPTASSAHIEYAGRVSAPPAQAASVSMSSSAAVYPRAMPALQQRPSSFVPPDGSSRFQLASSGAGWAIQIGAFRNPGLAREMAESARAEAPEQLRSAHLAVQTTAPFGNTVLYRARLANLSAGAALSACTHLNQRQLPCIVVPPAGS